MEMNQFIFRMNRKISQGAIFIQRRATKQFDQTTK